MADLDLRSGTQALLEAVAAINRDLEATAPWAVAKDPTRANELDHLLVRHLLSASVIIDGLEPILPRLAAKLRNQVTTPGGHLPPPRAVYPRLGAPTGSPVLQNDSPIHAAPSDHTTT